MKPALFGGLAALLFAAPPALAQSASRADWDHEALARRIVQSLGLRPGERVLLIAHPQFARDLIRPLRIEITRQGGTDLGVLDVLADPRPADVTARLGDVRAALREMLVTVDAAVMMPGSTSDHPAYQAMQDILASGHGRVIHLHWDANGSVGILPGQPVPPVFEVDRVYQRALLDLDYAALRRDQDAFIAALRAGEVHVTTPDGTDLRFRAGDRPVNRQDGDASAARAALARVLVDREVELPAGAIRVAPLEETVTGVVAMPVSAWGGVTVRDLRLTYRHGRIVDVTAASGAEAVRAELRGAGDAARFREFALGFNPQLAVPADRPWIPYYGYGAGVVRLSIGDNQELGGDVRGGYVRVTLFTNASVSVGGRAWVEQGILRTQ